MDSKVLILAAADLYCERSGNALATVSNKVVGYSTFFQRLKDGANMRMDTYEKARAWFEAEGIDFNELVPIEGQHTETASP